MGKYNPDQHHRRSIRLKNYDYASAGAYFVTICVQHRELLFGEFIDHKMCLNDAGQMIQNVWESLPERFQNIKVDEFVVMPNHVHGILVICDEPNVAVMDTSNRPTLGEMVGAFKSITTHRYIQGVRQKGWPPFDGRLWQRNYWEHIIINEKSLQHIREYIQSNPASWAQDSLHPKATEKRSNL